MGLTVDPDLWDVCEFTAAKVAAIVPGNLSTHHSTTINGVTVEFAPLATCASFRVLHGGIQVARGSIRRVGGAVRVKMHQRIRQGPWIGQLGLPARNFSSCDSDVLPEALVRFIASEEYLGPFRHSRSSLSRLQQALDGFGDMVPALLRENEGELDLADVLGEYIRPNMLIALSVVLYREGASGAVVNRLMQLAEAQGLDATGVSRRFFESETCAKAFQQFLASQPSQRDMHALNVALQMLPPRILDSLGGGENLRKNKVLMATIASTLKLNGFSLDPTHKIQGLDEAA